MEAIWMFVGTVLLRGFEFYIKARQADQQAIKDFHAFVEIMNAKGLTSVRLRLDSRNQVDRVAEMWNEEEKQNAGQN